MGQIPTLQKLPPTTQTPALRLQPIASDGNFGGIQSQQMAALGQGIGAFGQAVSQIGAKLQLDKEAADMDSAIAEYRSRERELLYGPNGFLTRKGAFATGVSVEAQRALDDLRLEFAKRFTSPRTQQAWDHWSNQSVESTIDLAARHEAVETYKYQQEAAQARVESAITKMLDDKNNPVEIRAREEEIAMKVAQAYAMYGPEVVDLETRKAISAAHASVIKSYIQEDNATLAYDYFKAHKENLLPEYAAQMEGALKARARKDELLAAAIKISDSDMTWEEKLNYLKKNYKDADEFDIMQRYVAHFQREKDYEARRDLAEREDAAMLEAQARAKQGDFLWEPKEPISAKGLFNIKEYQRRMFEAHLRNQSDIMDDHSTVMALFSMIHDDPERFMQIDLNDYVSRLKTDTWNELRREQHNLMKGRVSATAWKAQVNSMMNEGLWLLGYGLEQLKATRSASKKRKIEAARARFATMVNAQLPLLKPGDVTAAREWIMHELSNYAKEKSLLGIDILWPDEVRPLFMWESHERGGLRPTGQGPRLSGYVPETEREETLGALPAPTPAQAAQTKPATTASLPPALAAIADEEMGPPPPTPAKEPRRPAGVPPDWQWDPERRGWVRRVRGRVVAWYDEQKKLHYVNE